jgi:hypothetical protein
MRDPADRTEQADPLCRARALVDQVLTVLLRDDDTSGQRHDAVRVFLALLTPELLAALTRQVEAPHGWCARAVTAITAATAQLRNGQLEAARAELVAARGALVALTTPGPVAPDTVERGV